MATLKSSQIRFERRGRFANTLMANETSGTVELGRGSFHGAGRAVYVDPRAGSMWSAGGRPPVAIAGFRKPVGVLNCVTQRANGSAEIEGG